MSTEALLTLVITTAGQDSIQLPEKVMESYGLWMFKGRYDELVHGGFSWFISQLFVFFKIGGPIL